MTDNYDNRDEERDWPEEHPPHSHVEQAEPPAQESEDDAARLLIHTHPRRSAQRHRGTYRPPSELDRD